MLLRVCSIEKEHWYELGQEFENLIRSKYIFSTEWFLFNLKNSSCSQGILFFVIFSLPQFADSKVQMNYYDMNWLA